MNNEINSPEVPAAMQTEAWANMFDAIEAEMAVKHPVQKARYDDGELIDNEFTYRGVTFRKSDSVGQGYHGHYSIGGYHNGVSFTKRSEVLAHIDAQF